MKKHRFYLVVFNKSTNFAATVPATPPNNAYHGRTSFFITPSQTFFLCIYLVISKEM